MSTINSGSVVTARSPKLVEGMAGLAIGGHSRTTQTVAATSRSAAVQSVAQRAYSQADFDRENAAFERMYTSQARWAPLDMYFSRQVYVDASFALEKCEDHPDHRDLLQRDGSISMTHYTIKTLNIYLKNTPLKALGEELRVLNERVKNASRGFCPKPADKEFGAVYEKIFNVYRAIMARQFPTPNKEIREEDRSEMRKRAANLISKYYMKELVAIGEALLGTHQVSSRAEAGKRLLSGPRDLADALGCETWLQSDE